MLQINPDSSDVGVVSSGDESPNYKLSAFNCVSPIQLGCMARYVPLSRHKCRIYQTAIEIAIFFLKAI